MEKIEMSQSLDETLLENPNKKKCNLNCIYRHKLWIIIPTSILFGSFITLYLQNKYCTDNNLFCKNIIQTDGSF